MAIIDEVARAFGSHTLWKTRIERAADAGKSEFKPEDVCKDTLCTFGKWLHDPELPQEVRRSGHFGKVKQLHLDFHQAAGVAIGKAVSGDGEGARAEVVRGGYQQMAQKFYEGMFDWQRDSVAWAGIESGLLRDLLMALSGRLGLRLWATLALPALLALGSLWFVHSRAPAEADLGLFDGLFTAAALLAALFAFLLIRSVTRPLNALTEATRSLAKGDLGTVLPAMDRADQLGELARAVLVFKEQAIAVDRIAAAREREREKGENERRAALVQMAENIENQTAATIGQIARDSEQLYETAKRMAKGAQDVEENAQMVAAAAEQSLTNAETVAAATDRLSEQIRQIAAQMERSRGAVSEAVRAADNASHTVDSLGQAMGDIDQVVQLIAEIASQTNLLALNATVEAARAGEAGKGFAVVANEVKNLANQTGRQTDEISQRISHLKLMANQVIEAIRGTVGRVQDVEQIAAAVAQSVQEQQQATGQITQNVGQSARAAREVSDRIVAVADEAVHTGKQAGEVETMLRGMTEQVGALGRVLNRTVRTSTPEVNRRSAPRVDIDMEATLIHAGRAITGKVKDISTGGARLIGLPHLPTGQRATLKLDGLDLPVQVIESNGGFCRLRFDEAIQPMMERWLDRRLGTH